MNSDGTHWSLWCYYSPTNWNKKNDFWLELESAVTRGQKAWVCLGDFNDVVDQKEKRGGRDVIVNSHNFLRYGCHGYWIFL